MWCVVELKRLESVVRVPGRYVLTSTDAFITQGGEGQKDMESRWRGREALCKCSHDPRTGIAGFRLEQTKKRRG